MIVECCRVTVGEASECGGEFGRLLDVEVEVEAEGAEVCGEQVVGLGAGLEPAGARVDGLHAPAAGATENTTLKQRVRQLTHDNRTLEERLEAARSNNRFADRRIAQLEAQLTERPPVR